MVIIGIQFVATFILSCLSLKKTSKQLNKGLVIEILMHVINYIILGSASPPGVEYETVAVSITDKQQTNIELQHN